jgi:hypothetical protein
VVTRRGDIRQNDVNKEQARGNPPSPTRVIVAPSGELNTIPTAAALSAG